MTAMAAMVHTSYGQVWDTRRWAPLYSMISGALHMRMDCYIYEGSYQRESLHKAAIT